MSIETALILSIILLVGNGFFVASEFCLIAARRSYFDTKSQKGSHRAKVVLSALENIPYLIIGAQLGITFCSLALGALSEPAIAHAIEYFLKSSINPEITKIISLTCAIIIVTFLHTIIGEILPKNLSLSAPDRFATFFVPPLVILTAFFGPIVKSMNFFTQLVLKIFGVNLAIDSNNTFSPEDISGLVNESIKEGLIDKEDKKLLNSALMFDKRTIKSIMIPLEKLVTINSEITPEKLENLVAKTNFSRFPVKNNTDNYIGYIHIKDILDTKESRRNSSIPIRIIRPLASVFASQSIRSILKIMQRSGSHIAIVQNNKEKIIGLVTLQDVLEEIVD